jgi:hypothetical protein
VAEQVRTDTLGVGDLGATPGSREWATAVRARVYVATKETHIELKNLHSWLEIWRKHFACRELNARWRGMDGPASLVKELRALADYLENAG